MRNTWTALFTYGCSIKESRARLALGLNFIYRCSSRKYGSQPRARRWNSCWNTAIAKMTKNCTESRQLHGSPNDEKLESASGMIRDRTARRMGRTGNVSSCVFYQSEQAQMLRGHRKKLLLPAENKIHSPGNARGV
jgi:hypothetical protein